MLQCLDIMKEVEKVYTFKDLPILVGGGAMEYYGIRECGHDVDVIISRRDKIALLDMGYKLNLFGGKTEADVDATFSDFGGLHIDLIITLNQYGYDYFSETAKKIDDRLLVVSLENLLLTKFFAMSYSTCDKHKIDVKGVLNAIEIQQGYHD